jgi:hypothetical protein
MKAQWTTLLIAGVVLVSAPLMSLAQDNSNSSGTGPAGMGSTGWTGGNRGQTGGGGQASANQDPANPEAAQNQPWVASGEDLKGPPQRFPAGQTPE